MGSLHARTGLATMRLLGVRSVRVLALLLLLAAPPAYAQVDSLTTVVRETELAFARSMADRDRDAFARHIADDAIFFNGPQALRGKAAVVGAWSAFFEGPTAPFSWEPDQVQVLDTGELALSTGLVRDPGGRVIGRFNSIWRRDTTGRWLVVFDKGSPPEPADRP